MMDDKNMGLARSMTGRMQNSQPAPMQPRNEKMDMMGMMMEMHSMMSDIKAKMDALMSSEEPQTQAVPGQNAVG